MKNLIFFLFFTAAFSLNTIQAQNLSVEMIQFGTDVENREVVGADTAFASSIETVYCFTHITGAEGTAEIAHVWYYNDEEKARVPLTVRSNSWRTWSSKRILPSWTGEWSVQVEDAEGNVLESGSFVIQEN